MDEVKPLPYLKGLIKLNRTTNFTGTCPMCEGETDVQWYEEYRNDHCAASVMHIYCNVCGHTYTINYMPLSD